MASTFNNRPPRRLPSNAQVPRMEESKECKAVELRNEKQLTDPHKIQEPDTIEEKGRPDMEEESEDGWVDVQKPIPQPEPGKYVP